ncbi:family 43 glycosylhydrolase [Mucilaginibacter rubeus]|uniref:Family 43 glycosylhydrolase n=1 Tax=Mucilaginibacter rubeus TaxID=2027860 RepID=A0A5C1HXI7_9SPHI|nr:family 43 glycosylhydrolase [Mucilaginibacter rubeus]QEM10572.1 family 43 glycosylhydrolase [Mucilaginibacter rubeus]
MKKIKFWLLLLGCVSGMATQLSAQNPLIRDQFTADPSARVFGDRVYIYPSHDIKATPGHGRPGWFCMEDYHVFSSANLTDWTDHGVIISQTTVPWADPASYSMWAPDCIFRNGKYYMYFPTTAKGSENGRGFTIGVAIADKPYGPFTPQQEPIKGVHGIDPNVFIDKDGQAYLYWAQGNLYAAKLKENMLELASEPVILTEMPVKALKEGPYLFERKGVYYLTYPHVADKIERLEYAISNNPMGPFKFAGVLMDESASGCWTNHQSIIQFKNQWYLFYHNDDLSPNFDKNRSIRCDSLFFNHDGTIKKVIPTLRGVGITKASEKIQVDRYSDKDSTVQISFLDTAKRFDGWKTTFNNTGSWIRYNRVDFNGKKFKEIQVMANAEGPATIEVRLGNATGQLLATANIGKGSNWQVSQHRLTSLPPKIADLVIVLKSGTGANIDWISFK